MKSMVLRDSVLWFLSPPGPLPSAAPNSGCFSLRAQSLVLRAKGLAFQRSHAQTWGPMSPAGSPPASDGGGGGASVSSVPAGL